MLPKPKGLELDPQTENILLATFKALNASNPTLAEDCWLGMSLDTSLPLAVPVSATPHAITQYNNINCSLSAPFKVQLVTPYTTPCLHASPQNNTFDINVGFVYPATCNNITNYSLPLCPPQGRVFICGGSMAYTFLPQNWTGLCSLAFLLPDIDIIPGNQPIPIPAVDHITGRQKRAIELIPILVGLGLSGALATGTAGLGVAIHKFNELSKLLINDMETLSKSIQDIQDQIDSLAKVVLQNRGLDLLTAEKGGICLAVQERCFFYANKSGIVRDRIKKLQEDLAKRRKELFDNPFWSAWNGILPYLLPLLGPLVSVFLIMLIGPCVVRWMITFVNNRLTSILAKPIQVHYHQLELNERENQYEPRPPTRPYDDIA